MQCKQLEEDEVWAEWEEWSGVGGHFQHHLLHLGTVVSTVKSPMGKEK